MLVSFVPALLRQCALVLLLVQVCLGATLYERSSAQFKARAQQTHRDDYTFVVLGDSRDGDAMFKKALALARSFHPLFILHGGDYSESGGDEETRRFLAIVNGIAPEIPLFVVMGNHENRDVFAREIGPFDFTLQSKRLGLTLVAVDNSDYALKPAELDYLRSRLSLATGASFVAMHVPPRTERWSWHTFTEGADDLERLLADGRVQGAFFSHMHLYDRSVFGGVPAIITGGAGAPLVIFGFPGEAVHHILVVRVKNGKASFEKVRIPK